MSLNLITKSIDPSFRDRSITETQNYTAFAALHDNGTVSFWGRINDGSPDPTSAQIKDFSALQAKIDKLIDGTTHQATQLFCSGNGFAAIRSDGLGILWLNDSSDPVTTANDKEVTTIATDVNGFCGIYSDGSAFYFSNGQILNLEMPQNELAIQVSACAWGFNVITNSGSAINIYSPSKNTTYDSKIINFDGSIITRTFSTEKYFWMLSDNGDVFNNDGTKIYSDTTKPIINIATNNSSQVGITSDGIIVSLIGSDIPDQPENSKVVSITSSVNEFVALYDDGSAVRFGANTDVEYTPENDSKKVFQVVSSWSQFAFLLNDGTVIQNASNKFVPVPNISNAVKLYATSGGWTEGGFAALKEDGSVVTWGNPKWGGDSSSVTEQLQSGVVDIFSNGEAFAALKEDGSVVVWGGNGGGGASYDPDQNNSRIITIATYQTDECLYLPGTEAADHIIGGSNNDILLGLEGDDLFTGSAGNDLIFGGDGNDTADYSQANSSLEIDLYTSKVKGSGLDTLVSIENVAGGTGDDLITGNDASNKITAGSGNDTVNAGGGNDLIIGGDGAGNDTYNGGTGVDTIKYTSANSGITVNLSASSNHAKSTLSGDKAGIGIDQLLGIEDITAGKYDDFLTGNTAVNRIEAGSGNDTIDGRASADILIGGKGNDTYIVDLYKKAITTLALQDVITEESSEGNDTLRLRLTKDEKLTAQTFTLAANLENLDASNTSTNKINLTGNSAANILTGNAESNTMDGSSGADTLIGGAGKDTLTGGTGSDYFDFNIITESGITASTRDVIKDFSKSQGDKIDLRTIDAKSGGTSNDAFGFVSKAPSIDGTASNGKLWYANGVLYGSTDNDKAAEFSIQVTLTGISAFNATDYIFL
jgi:Ca2+-binding RTX toxin-like protein